MDPSPDTNGSEPAPVFHIEEAESCPLYAVEDEFQISQGIFLVPHGKAPCLILAKDVKKIRKARSAGDEAAAPGNRFECGGCTGFIRFTDKLDLTRSSGRMEDLVDLLISFPIFEGLDRAEIQDVLSYLRLDRFNRFATILRKGGSGRNLFIVLSGMVEVQGEDGMTLATIGKGEVFGEMSVLSGNPVGASVVAAEPTTVLRVGAESFRRVLNRHPGLQMAFTRLLVRRMAEINRARSEQFSCGLAGKLSEMPPADLFQTFYINQKTGVLVLKLPRESAQLSFRDGKLVDVQYGGRRGEEAFFDLLKLRHGHFKFFPGLSADKMEASEIGDFMYLIIEGLRRIEQDDQAFLRTVIPTLL